MKFRQRCETCGEWFERNRPPSKIDRHGGPPRFCSPACAGVARRGERHPKWRGGEWSALVHGTRRAFVWVDEEMRHRLHQTLSRALRARVNWLLAHPGEELTSDDVIHHRNEDAMDDRPENLLKYTSHAAHAEAHGYPVAAHQRRQRLPDKPCEVCGTPVRPWRRFCSQTCKGTGIAEALRRANLGKKASPAAREKMRQSALARWQRART